MFGTRRRIELLEEELRTAAGHHTELAGHLRGQLAGGAYDHSSSLITRSGAVQLAGIHDSNAADSTAMADTIHHALHPNLDQENQ